MSKAKTSQAKAQPKPANAGIPTLEAVLGIEPAQQFQFSGRVFTATTVTLTEQVAYNAAAQTEKLDEQAKAIARLLNRRLVMGEELSEAEVMDLDVTTLNRLVLMLQGQFRPRVDGDEGKSSRK